MTTESGFIITNKSRTLFVAKDDNDYCYHTSVLRHVYIFDTYAAASSILNMGPPTREYWGTTALARLMRTAVVKPVTLTIEE